MVSPLKNAAKDNTVEIPRKLRLPSPSPVQLILEALMSMASVPEARGDDRIE